MVMGAQEGGGALSTVGAQGGGLRILEDPVCQAPGQGRMPSLRRAQPCGAERGAGPLGEGWEAAEVRPWPVLVLLPVGL